MQIKFDNMKRPKLRILLFYILLPLVNDTVLKKSNEKLFRKKFSIWSFKPIVTLHTTIIYMSNFRRLGKKETTNFKAKYTYGNKQKGIKNCHLNIRSLKYKMHEIKNILSTESPDILGLSEVELNKESLDVDTLKVPNYNILFPLSWEGSGNARTVVYLKKSMTYERIEQLESINFQSIWFSVTLKNGSKVYFCHGYREHLDTLANQRDQLNLFLAQWDKALEYKNQKDKNEIHICLEMNIDSLN